MTLSARLITAIYIGGLMMPAYAWAISSTQMRTVQCEAAKALLRQFPPREESVAYSLDPPTPVSRFYSKAFISTGWGDNSPSQQLVDRFYNAKAASAFRCKQVASLAAQRGYRVFDQAPAQAASDVSITRISLPILNEARSQAIVEVSNTSKWGGMSNLVLLARRNNQWVVVGGKPLSIS